MPRYQVQVLDVCSPWGLIRHLRVQRGDKDQASRGTIFNA
jgi:hypothetical protein